MTFKADLEKQVAVLLQVEAAYTDALEELHRLYPGFTTETLSEEFQKWNLSDDRLRLWVSALRKAGLR